MKGRRLLFIQTQAENAGAQEVSRLLGEKLAQRGHEVQHVFFYRKSDDFFEPPNTVMIREQRPANPLAFMYFLFSLYRQIRSFEPDCVFCFQHFGNTIGAPIAKLAGCKVVVANQVTAPSLVGKALTEIDRVLGMLGFYDKITVNSKELKECYSQYASGYVTRLSLIPQGFESKFTNADLKSAREDFNLPANVPLIGCCARLNPKKQLDKVIALLPSNPTWHFAIAGQGPDFERLQSIAKEFGVQDRTHFIGELPPTNVGSFLASLDAFAFPSAAESFGLAAVEAAQAGVPVVANELQVLKEVLQTNSGPCALFADAEDEKAFEGATKQVLSDKVLAQELTERGKDLQTKYSLDKMVAAYESLAQPAPKSVKKTEAIVS